MFWATILQREAYFLAVFLAVFSRPGILSYGLFPFEVATEFVHSSAHSESDITSTRLDIVTVYSIKL